MCDRIPEVPPIILPLADHNGPLWSVMIPTYNCSTYLRATLESVLAQDPGPELMQIEVVDDYSTDSDVFALVQEVGKGRVGFYRQEKNKGSLRNFETCLNRSKGKWVHLLHGDDIIKNGFYQEIQTLFNKHPEAGAAFTNNSYLDEHGNEYISSERLKEEPGILHNWLYQIAEKNLVQPPAIVVKRAVYEKLGGFFGVHYGEDWEMWVRIAAHYPIAYSPKTLAGYRLHYNNITTRAFFSGQSVDDVGKVIEIISQYIPKERQRKLRKVARKNLSLFFAKSSHDLYHVHKNAKAAYLIAKKALIMDQNIGTVLWAFRLFAKYFTHYRP